MCLLDRKLMTPKLQGYTVGQATALSDPMLLPRVRQYRRNISARFRAYNKDMIRKIDDSEAYVSKKIDGEFNALVYQEGEAILLNPGGTVRSGLPAIKEAAETLKAAGINQALILGEFHYYEDNRRERVHDVVRAARRPEPEDISRLRFAPFDIDEIDGVSFAGEYGKALDRLKDLFSETEKVRPVRTEKISKQSEIKELFESWVEEEGGEGLVVRSERQGCYKIKPQHTLDAVVIGFAEGTDERAGMLHDLLLATIRPSGEFQVMGRVGGGFSDDQRRNLLSDLEEMAVNSDYAEVNSDRIAYKMVRPQWVVEISCLDVIAESTRGASIDTMVLEWSEEKTRWLTVRRMPLVSVISPQFRRIREDKTPVPEDIRISQLTDLVEIPGISAQPREISLPKSEIIRRRVAVKVLKGKEMVRKLLLWKTNKEEQSAEYPAYVVHLTDFSPNRAEPLKREIRVSNSMDQIEEMWDALETKNFVRGWKEPAEG